MPTLKSVSALIPNYNGRGLLERYLPGIVRAIDAYRGERQIVLVDDGSTDDSVDFVERWFPRIELVRLERNVGPVGAYNAGLARCTNEVVLRLNNDYDVDQHFLEPLVGHLAAEDVFGACGAVTLASQPGRDESLAYGRFKWGIFHLVQPGLSGDVKVQSPCPVLFPYGGVCVYDRRKLTQLGGYDTLYAPIYWEDVDLGYRAWKRGWRSIYEPNSRATHRHMATMSRIKPQLELTRLVRRNILLFTWRNITDRDLMLSHLALLAARLAWHLARRERLFVQILRSAAERLPQVRARRAAERAATRWSDREVLSLWSRFVG